MRNFSGTNVFKITRFDLRTNRKSIIGWLITVFSIMFLYMILFPSIQDVAKVEMEMMPAELMQFMGMNAMADLANFSTYFGMIYMLVIIAISVFAASYTSGLIYKEEKERTIEFLYSLEVSRSEIFISKALSGFIGMLMVIFSAIVAAIISGLINGGVTFHIGEVIKIGILCGFIPLIFWGISLLLVGLTAKIRITMVSSMMVFVSYILGYLAILLGEKADWLTYVSPFEIFKPEAMLDLGTNELIAFICYLVVTILCFIVGITTYNRRDFHV